MSTTKLIPESDKTTVRTLLHESIPVTGSLISGTYGAKTDIRGDNIKTYTHGMFQSTFDYPFLSSSANHIFDTTVGVNPNDTVHYPAQIASGTVAGDHGAPKRNIYTQMSQMLFGYDATGSQRQTTVSGSTEDGATVIDDPMFINFARLLAKDEIKKGTFRLTLGLKPDYDTPFLHQFHIGDFGASTNFNDTNSPAGEFGVLRSGSSTTATDAANNDAVGLVFYQAGIVVLDVSGSIDIAAANQSRPPNLIEFAKSTNTIPQLLTYTGSIESGTMDQISDGLRHRIFNISFENSTELNSTIYFCRVGASEFNYSSNPTYVSESKIINKESSPTANPVSYISTIGLYADDGACVATAKLSEPLRKSNDNEFTLRVRLDY